MLPRKESEGCIVITYADIQRVNAEITTTPIKGKNYAEVNQRITAFRKLYPTGFIKTQIIRLDEDFKTGVCVIRAEVGYGDTILATGIAYEKADSSYINKTSYIENCETSAVGRALGNAGFGIDTSVASFEEVQNAINNQGKILRQAQDDRTFVQVDRAEDPDGILVCTKCGQVIDVKVHDYSARKYGRPLCRDCQRTEPTK